MSGTEQFTRGSVVRGAAGRDKGHLLCVLGTEGEYLLLADGKRRRLASPKRKRSRHVEHIGRFGHPVMERLGNGETVGNKELRRALAALRDELGG